MELTEKEKDLIEMIRNFRSARPNGAKEMEYYIRSCSTNNSKKTKINQPSPSSRGRGLL